LKDRLLVGQDDGGVASEDLLEQEFPPSDPAGIVFVDDNFNTRFLSEPLAHVFAKPRVFGHERAQPGLKTLFIAGAVAHEDPNRHRATLIDEMLPLLTGRTTWFSAAPVLPQALPKIIASAWQVISLPPRRT
jgi:hypothetical protein